MRAAVHRALLDHVLQFREQLVEALLLWKRAEAPLQLALRVAAHEHQARAVLPNRFDALLRAHPHDALSHADRPERGVRAAVMNENEHPLADRERGLALDTHRDVADLTAQCFDHHFLLVRRVASKLALDRDAVPGAELAAGTHE